MNILIVDDEAAIIHIIKKVVNWEKAGIEQVFSAYNAMEARELLRKHNIQIVLCDIEMPQESGLDLIHWLKEYKPEIISIILTGFPDFHYAQNAISNGVYKFLLKPVKYKELEKTIYEATLRIKKGEEEERQRRLGIYMEKNKKKVLKNFFLELLQGEIIPDQIWIQREAEKRGLITEQLLLSGMVLFKFVKGNTFSSDNSLLWFSMVNISEELFPSVISFEYEGKLVWVIKNPLDKEEIYKMCGNFLNKVSRYLKYDLFVYLTIESIILENVPGQYELLSRAARELYKVGKAVYFVDDYANYLLKKGKVSGREARLIEQVRLYLEAHYMEKIGRSEIEGLVHLNQDYLNRLFKSSIGYTLIEYIQYCRIRRAKELLGDRDFAIRDIAGEVGFDSPPYFSKMFKKWVGCSPMEYRDKNENDEKV